MSESLSESELLARTAQTIEAIVSSLAHKKTVETIRTGASGILNTPADPKVQQIVASRHKYNDGNHPFLFRILSLLEGKEARVHMRKAPNDGDIGGDLDLLIQEKCSPGSVFVLLQGNACISKQYEQSQPAGLATQSATISGDIDVISAPQVFGEMGYLLGETTATVWIDSDAEVLEIPSSVFTEMMNDPELKIELVKLLRERLIKQAEGALKAGESVAMRLEERIGNTGQSDNDGGLIYQKELAEGGFGMVSSLRRYGEVSLQGVEELGINDPLPVVNQTEAQVVKIVHPKIGSVEDIQKVNDQLLAERALQETVNRSVRRRFKDSIDRIKNKIVIKYGNLDAHETAIAITKALFKFCVPVNPIAIEMALKRFEYVRLQLNARLSHTKLAQYIIDSCSTVVPQPHKSKAPFMKVEELIEGVGGEHLIAQVSDFLEEERTTFALSMTQSIEAVNRAGIIHRDLKFENIRIDQRGVPHIIDLGISHQFGNGWQENENFQEKISTTSGTLMTMAPEQVNGTAHLKSDVFALGCMLYQLYSASHQYPFDRIVSGVNVFYQLQGKKMNIQDIRLQVIMGVASGKFSYTHYVTKEQIPDPSMRDLITRMLAFNPDERPSVREVRKEIVKIHHLENADNITTVLGAGYKAIMQRVSNIEASESILDYHPNANVEQILQEDGGILGATLVNQHQTEFDRTANAFISLTSDDRQKIKRWILRSHPFLYEGKTYYIDRVGMQSVLLRDAEKQRITIPLSSLLSVLHS